MSSFEHLKELHQRFDDLAAQVASNEQMLEEEKENLSSEDKQEVTEILQGWRKEQNALHQKIETLIPQAASDAVSNMQGYYEVVGGGVEALVKSDEADRLLMSALGSENLKATATWEKDFSSSNQRKAEKAARASDTITELCELEERYPEIGRLVLSSMAGIRSVVVPSIAADSTVQREQPAVVGKSEEQITEEAKPLSESAGRALRLVTGDRKTALKILDRSSSANIAGDLLELKELRPEEVKAFLNSLQMDAQAEIFDGGLPNEYTGSFFLFDSAQVADHLERQFVADQKGDTDSVYALSSLGLLAEEAEEALQTNDEKRLGQVLGIIAFLGHKRAKEICDYDYRTASGGDLDHTMANRRRVKDFLKSYKKPIMRLSAELEIPSSTIEPTERRSKRSAAAERIASVAQEQATAVIEEAKKAFEAAEIDE